MNLKLLLAYATWILILLNLLVFMAANIGGAADMLALSGSPAVDMAEPWRIVSYMFLHTYPMHLICNIVALLFIGAWYESRLSGLSMTAVYLLSGIIGGMAFIAAGSVAQGDIRLSGCSASILGIGACVLCNRRRPMSHWRFILFAALAIAATGVAGPNPAGSLAHVAGIIAGALAGRLHKPLPAADSSINPTLLNKIEQSGFSSLSASERADLFMNNRR